MFSSYHDENIPHVSILPIVFDPNRTTSITHVQESGAFSALRRCDTFCTNFEGTFQCSCDPGYTLDAADSAGYSCRHINECMDEGTGDPCLTHDYSRCFNLVGGVTCNCQEGYQGAPIGPAGDGVNATACTVVPPPSRPGPP